MNGLYLICITILIISINSGNVLGTSFEGCTKARCPYFPAPPANVTFFPHDTNCSRYCMCDWYSTVHDMPCPAGLHWNSKLDTCDWPWNSGCNSSNITTTTTAPTTTTSKPTTTTTTTTPKPPSPPVAGCRNSRCPFYPAPPANVTFFPHDSDCGRYCMCDWYSTVHDMPCPAGLHWNSKLDTCDWPWNSGCNSSNITTTTTTPTTTTPKPTTTTTTTTPKPPSPPVAGCRNSRCPFYPAPPANVTFFPHDSDCGRYCMCDWYSTVHDMSCPAGLHWNSKLDTCDWPWNSGCNSSNITTTTTAPTTTTSKPTTTTTTTTPKPPNPSVAGCRNSRCPFYPAPPANVTFFPHDSDCGRYCMCDWFSTVHNMSCPNGLHWNAVLDTCDWPRSAGCDKTYDAINSADIRADIVPIATGGCLKARCPQYPAPPANVTFFPHDSDCTRYCMCDWYGKAHNMPCAKNLHWNRKLNTCDWPNHAGCK